MKGLLPLYGLLWASAAAAGVPFVQSGGDTIEIREAEGVAAEVVYNNGLSQNSGMGIFELEIAGVVVDVEIKVNEPGKDNQETVIVTPRDPGLIAVPVEADVADGESIVIDIMLPMF